MKRSVLCPIALGAFLALAASASCASSGAGAASTGTGGAAGAGGSGTSGSGAGGSGGSAADSTDAGIYDAGQPDGSASACPPELQFIYILAAKGDLYEFDPPTLTSSLVGKIDCPTTSSPYSMAVDRKGQAWIVMQDGSLFQVDTKTAKCSPTSFAPGQHGFTTFGMGFSSNAPGSDDETLYVSDGTMGQGLAKIDLQTMTLTPIGAYDQLDARAELTGTGDARLLGAFEGTPYVVAEIDKSNAHILSQAPQPTISYLSGSSHFAFATWGGDLWLFVGPTPFTYVYRYRPSDGTTTPVKYLNFPVVGAGVSTCAPTKPPS